MTVFTAAYLCRLGLWVWAAAALQGVLAWGSWRLCKRMVADAEARCRLAGFHLAALAILPAITLAVVHGVMLGMAGEPAGAGTRYPVTATLDGATAAIAPFALALIVWLLGAVVMTTRLANELRAVRHARGEPAPFALDALVGRLAVGVGLRRRVRVVVGEAACPSVIGWRRPVLLVPRDFAARLGEPEREAVLLHELAHVRRDDFAWNVIQRLIVAALWWNPVAWRLYRDLAEEREVCCDSLAASGGARAPALARGLVALAEDARAARLAQAAAGGGALAQRLERLLTPSRRRPPPIGALAVAAVLVLACLGVGLVSRADVAGRDLCLASALGPAISVQARDPAGAFALNIRQGRVLQASVDGRALPAGHIRQAGRHVVLVGPRDEVLVALTVFPHARIRWNARS